MLCEGAFPRGTQRTGKIMTDWMKSPDLVARMLGASRRIASNEEHTAEVDRRFEASGRSLAGYLFEASGRPEKNVRDLVSMGLVDPENRCAIAIVEHAGTSEPIKAPEEIAGSIMKSASDRQTVVFAAALSRRLKSGQMDDRETAVAFERLSEMSDGSGDERAAQIAADGFAGVVRSGVHARHMQRATRDMDIEMA